MEREQMTDADVVEQFEDKLKDEPGIQRHRIR